MRENTEERSIVYDGAARASQLLVFLNLLFIVASYEAFLDILFLNAPPHEILMLLIYCIGIFFLCISLYFTPYSVMGFFSCFSRTKICPLRVVLPTHECMV